MPENQAAIAAFYDHEIDSALEPERSVRDWGADEVFATPPRRRFRKAHRGSDPASSWLTQGDEQAIARIRRESHARPAPRLPEAPTAETVRDPSATQDAHGQSAAETARGPRAAQDGRDPSAASEVLEAPLAPATAPAPDVEFTSMTAEPAGRRTVVVTGRPEGEPRPVRNDRRRPPRTAIDRIGGRPDHIAAWAFGLGLTLILVAVTTADAAPL